MKTIQLIKKVADDIVENKKYKVVQKSDKLRFLIVDVASAVIMFGTNPKEPKYDEFKEVLVRNISEEFKSTKIFETFKAGHWLISKEEDHNREWTNEEKELIYKYGTQAVDAQTYDYIFKNTDTGEEFVVTRKAKSHT